ncbi:hypothetical protein ACH4LK_19000 [Streptomyces lydicus]|uniref:hypothetical protein n=1 Tax=Streptomyces lydicus TaxID=47763 RepID=UPI0037AAAEF9
MRTARTLFASAVMTALLAVAAPTAAASPVAELRATDVSSSSIGHDRDSYGRGDGDGHGWSRHRECRHHRHCHHRFYGCRHHHRRHDYRPIGGVHTGGGALMR